MSAGEDGHRGKKPKKEVLEPMYFFLREKYLLKLRQADPQTMATTSDEMVNTFFCCA